MTDSAATRAAVMGALTYHCAHTGTPVNGECADCATLRDEVLTALATVGPSAALDVNGNRTFRVTRITVNDGSKLVLGPEDQAFFIAVTHQGQYPSRYTFALLERVDPDA